VFLTEAHLARHFAGRRREDIMGLHFTSPDNTSRAGALDIDHHGPTSTAPEVNWKAALAWYVDLVSRGFRPLLTASNARGGYHLLVIFADPAPTRRVFHFLNSLVADHARHGMGTAPELFPKQPSVAPPGNPGQYGNWLRLPGRHHTDEGHWSRLWNGERCLDGTEAFEFILALTGDPIDLLPESPPPEPPRPTRARPHYRYDAGDGLARRIAAYMARLPAGLGEGAGRDDVAYHFASFLARDLALSDEICLAWLERWDGNNAVRKGAAVLTEILSNARKYGRAEVGSGLGAAAWGKHMILTARSGGVS
jgi:hypothetical protein